MAKKIPKKKQKIVYLILFLLILILILLFILFFSKKTESIFKNPQTLRSLILKFNFLSPLVLILLVILQVITAPIPGQIIGIVSGYIFGPFFGTIYCMIGILLGSFLAFFVARKFGRPFVEKMVKKETIKKFDKKVLKYGLFPLFLMYLLPAFPDDALCFLAGLSKIKTRDFLFISFIGRLPGFLILNLIGSGLISPENRNITLFLFGLICLVSFFLYLQREKIEKIIFKKLNKP
jgi:uncharacterized membrane protein YdjX (TVP38/TMEM64 family)